MLRQSLVILFLLGLTISVDGFLWPPQRRVVHIHHCHCGRSLLDMAKKLEEPDERRDVADLLDLEEDYPGLDNLLDHLDTKRDGTINTEALATLLKRSGSNSAPVKRVTCHCGRALVDDFNQGLL